MTALSVVFFADAPTLILLLVLYSLRRELMGNWRGITVIAWGCALFFHRILFLPEAISQSDANLFQLQFFGIYRDAILNFGEIPFWNPYIGTGVPNLANPISAMFYPLTPVFLFLNIYKAMSLFVVCHYFLAGVFALLLGRVIFKAPQAALAFGILYAFNGWAMMKSAHQPAIEYLFAYAWLPLAALSFERAVDGRSILASCVSAGAALAWAGTACPNMFVYGVILAAAALPIRIAALAVSRRTNAIAVGLATAAGAVIFAMALGAIEYGPARELAEFSKKSRLGMLEPEGWRGQALGVWTLVKMFFPYVKGRPFGVYYSSGVVALGAALFGLYAAVKPKSKRTVAIGAAGILILGALLATKTRLYDALARLSTVFGLSSLMPAVLVLLVVPVAILAAAGVDAMSRQQWRLSGRRSYVIVAAMFLELFIGFGVIYPRYGERRLTFKYEDEIADFPHLNLILDEGYDGRILAQSPSEGEILAPSYAVLDRGLSRLNVSAGDFAPDWLTETLDPIVAQPDVDTLTALGVTWVASTRPLDRFEDGSVVGWPGVRKHYEDNVFIPLRNHPGWLAWDRHVLLYHVSTVPAVVRAEPLDKFAIVQGRSTTPLEELGEGPVSRFAEWTGVVDAVRTANSVAFALPETAPVRYFFAVTNYPGWKVTADGAETEHATAAKAFLIADVPRGTGVVELTFEPTHWRVYMALAVAAMILTVIAMGREWKASTSPETPRGR